MLCEDVEQLRRDVGRIERAESDARQARNPSQPIQEVGQVFVLDVGPVPPAYGGLAVSAYMDACYDDFLMPGRDEPERFSYHVIGCFTVNSRPGFVYNTIGAKGITAILDFQKGTRVALESS